MKIPQQGKRLSVGQLRPAIAGIADHVVVGLTVFVNAKVDYSGDPARNLRPSDFVHALRR
ncbi:MAG: hypothetical protein QM756_36230 [Polyangiaceae bacterium]